MVYRAAVTDHDICLATMTCNSANSLLFHARLRTKTIEIINELDSADWANIYGKDDVVASKFNKIL